MTPPSSDPIAGLIPACRSALLASIEESLDSASRQSVGFATRLLHASPRLAVDVGRPVAFEVAGALDALPYEGYPPIAYLGYAIGAGETDQNVVAAFVERFRVVGERAGPTLLGLVADDVALLGVADGLARLPEEAALAGAVVDAETKAPSLPSAPSRFRALALDLLDDRGRLGVQPPALDANAAVADFALRRGWPSPYRTTRPSATKARSDALARILSEPAPGPGDLERAVTLATALDVLVSEAASEAVPTAGAVAQILSRTQGALKRWVWDESGRKAVAPARWLIDNEYHVQALLYATLYPVFGADVTEEQYLPGHGNAQPRYDLAIESLSLIIEVKFVRTKKDFKTVEEQIAGDLGLYFGDHSPFSSLIAYVYDDCDVHYPERYAALRDALLKRDPRIVDVVLVRRPSMIPDRSGRG